MSSILQIEINQPGDDRATEQKHKKDAQLVPSCFTLEGLPPTQSRRFTGFAAHEFCASTVKRGHHQTVLPSSCARRKTLRAGSGAFCTSSRTFCWFSGEVAAA